MKVIGIILILASFGGFMAGEPVGAAAALALGVILVVLGVRRKKKAPQHTPQPAADPAPEKNKENLKVAGISYRTEAVESLGTRNEEYDSSKKYIINNMADDYIYEYDFPTLPAELRFEPDNPHDPNAIAVYAAGTLIGYVKSGSTSHIRNLINSGRIESAVCKIRGGNFKHYDSMTEEFEDEKANYSATVTLNLKS